MVPVSAFDDGSGLDFGASDPDFGPGDQGPPPLTLEERAGVLDDLAELEVFRTLLEPTGVKGIVVDCPDCGVPLEVVLPTSALLAAGSGPEVVEVDIDSYRLRCRAPRSGDLADAAAAGP